MHQKLVPEPFLILLNNPKQPLHARNHFKKLTSFLLSNTVPFNQQIYQKQKGSGTSNQLPFRLQNKFTKILLFVIYYLTKCDDVT